MLSPVLVPFQLLISPACSLQACCLLCLFPSNYLFPQPVPPCNLFVSCACSLHACCLLCLFSASFLSLMLIPSKFFLYPCACYLQVFISCAWYYDCASFNVSCKLFFIIFYLSGLFPKTIDLNQNASHHLSHSLKQCSDYEDTWPRPGDSLLIPIQNIYSTWGFHMAPPVYVLHEHTELHVLRCRWNSAACFLHGKAVPSRQGHHYGETWSRSYPRSPNGSPLCMSYMNKHEQTWTVWGWRQNSPVCFLSVF
jgi:hypothetical protein